MAKEFDLRAGVPLDIGEQVAKTANEINEVYSKAYRIGQLNAFREVQEFIAKEQDIEKIEDFIRDRWCDVYKPPVKP